MTFTAFSVGPESPMRAGQTTAMQTSRASDLGIVRKLRGHEAALYRDHLLRLDPESRRNRFMGAVSDEYIRAYVGDRIGSDRVVYGFFVGGALRGVAELRPTGRGQAELAFSIEAPWQGRGVGAALFGRALLAARNRFYRRLHVSCLAENRAMQRLAAKFDAEIRFEAGSACGELRTGPATPISFAREATSDLSDAVFAAFEGGWLARGDRSNQIGPRHAARVVRGPADRRPPHHAGPLFLQPQSPAW